MVRWYEAGLPMLAETALLVMGYLALGRCS